MAATLDLFNEFWRRTEREDIFRRHYNGLVRKARPFTLDAELAGLIRELADKAAPRAMYRYLGAARLPYPVMWLECDYAAAGFSLDTKLHFGTPRRVGWLIEQDPRNAPGAPAIVDGYRVTRVASVVNENDGQLTPSVYPVSHYVDLKDHITNFHYDGGGAMAAAIERVNAEATYTNLAWTPYAPEIRNGKAIVEAPKLKVWGKAAMASPLYGHNKVSLSQLYLEKVALQSLENDADALLMHGMSDQTGELSFVVAALALMNEVPVRYVPYRPSGSLLCKGRMRPYMTSSIVTIEVPATRRRVREIDKHLQSRGEAAKRARHEVRGYFRHVTKLPLSNPERWERTTDRNGRPCWRTWIEHHQRGDASLGWVRQTYAVTAASGARLELEGASS